jgi:trimeric autotransporter adhesin
VLVAIVVVAAVSPTGPASAADCTLSGDGTSGTPYLVGVAADLAKVGVGACGLGAHYRQTAALILVGSDPAATNHTPIGTSVARFTGVYDGQGFTISGLQIVVATQYVGLFGSTGGAIIRDVHVTDATVSGTRFVGGLIGYADSDTEVSDSSFSGAVTGTRLGLAEVGGLIGDASDVTVSGSSSSGTVTGSDAAGGLIGYAFGVTVADSSSSSTVSGRLYVGGLIGAGYVVTISDSSASGAVNGMDSVGGLIGDTDEAAISDSSASGAVDGTREVGGLVGLAAAAKVHRSTATGNVTGEMILGGLIGRAYANGTDMTEVVDSSASGTVTGTCCYVGGLIGLAYDVMITRAHASGDVTSGDDEFSAAGGLIGEAINESRVADVTIRDTTATGTVTATGDYAGGLIGWMFSYPFPFPAGTRLITTVINTSATGAVRGRDYVGGLIGDAYDVAVTTSYSTGAVTGGSGMAEVGGLIGAATRAVTVTGSFWDEQASGVTASAGGTGRTTAQMRTLTTFASADWRIAAGWVPYVDGESVWGVCSSVNDGYPFLLWRFETAPCSAPAATSPPAGPTLACTPLPPRIGSEVTCTVTGGDPGLVILWRAAFNPTFAGEGVLLGEDGVGTFSFTVPRAALGQVVTVELVDWFAPAVLGVVGGPVPTSVPSGEGPVPVWTLGMLALAGVLALRRGSRSGRSAVHVG